MIKIKYMALAVIDLSRQWWVEPEGMQPHTFSMTMSMTLISSKYEDVLERMVRQHYGITDRIMWEDMFEKAVERLAFNAPKFEAAGQNTWKLVDCDHDWAPYTGLRECYDYCKKCDKRKDL